MTASAFLRKENTLLAVSLKTGGFAILAYSAFNPNTLEKLRLVVSRLSPVNGPLVF